MNVDIDWSQDDFTLLQQQFFLTFQNLEQVECIEGADRLTVRFAWQNNYFYLHLEYYCYSIWIEACDQCSRELLKDLYHYLKSSA